MGNRCVTPCTSTTPNLKSRIRCLYFCCLSGANINVIHPPTQDEVDKTLDSENNFQDPISVIVDSVTFRKKSNNATGTTTTNTDIK